MSMRKIWKGGQVSSALMMRVPQTVWSNWEKREKPGAARKQQEGIAARPDQRNGTKVSAPNVSIGVSLFGGELFRVPLMKE